MQTFPSLQFGAGPPAQEPPEQASLVVHAFPSLQEAVLFANTQPAAPLQESLVQPFPSLQTSAVPPTQEAAVHVSLVVQELPSLHGDVLFRCAHPAAGAQESFVQPFPSLQERAAPPTHTPLAQVSLVVQELPSLHGDVLFVNTHPVPGLQESVVQALPSLHVIAAPALHEPLEHVSAPVHASPSLQAFVLFVCTQPEAGAQESVVQPFASSQLTSEPPVHVPPKHFSPVVHALPSLHVRPSGSGT